MNKPLSLDLGTASVRIRHRATGAIFSFLSVIAVDTHTDEVVALGEEAQDLIGRTPGNIHVCRPIRDGVVADYDLAVRMLKEYFQKTHMGGAGSHPVVITAVPFETSDEERRALADVICDAGAKKVRFVPASLAAAYGAGLSPTNPRASMVVDIGAGSTESAVIARGKVLAAKSTFFAGDAFDRAILNGLKEKRAIVIGEVAAQNLKHTLGSALPPTGSPAPVTVIGRNVKTGAVAQSDVTAEDIYRALSPTFGHILQQLGDLLRSVPESTREELRAGGIVLCGGGAKLNGIATALANGLGCPVAAMSRGEDCTVNGLSRIVSEKLPVSF